MIYQNSAWRKATGFSLDPTGKPLEPVVEIKKGSIYKGNEIKKLWKNQTIKFIAMNDFTGENEELTGTIIGGYRAAKRRFPAECANIGEGNYLVEVKNRAGLFVVSKEDILKVL